MSGPAILIATAMLAGFTVQPALAVAASAAPAFPEVGNGGAVQNADGRVEVFAVDDGDGSVWHTWETTPGGTWHGWVSLGGTTFDAAPVASINSNGTLAVFDTATDGHLYVDSQVSPGGAWTGWSSLGAPGGGLEGGNIAVGQNADGRLEAFAIGISQQGVWHIWQGAPSGSWGGWAELGGELGGSLSVARNADGRLEAFDVQLAASGAEMVQHIWQLGPGGAWSSWAHIGGVGDETTSMGNAARNKDGTLELLATQAGSGASSLYASQTTPGGSWTGFSGMNGATLTGDPAVLYDGAFLEAFVATTNDTMVAEARTNVDDQFINWTNSPGPQGGVAGSLLAPVMNSSGTIDVFATGLNTAGIWFNQFNPGSRTWGTWSILS